MESPSSPTAIPRRTSSLTPLRPSEKQTKQPLRTLPEDPFLTDNMNATPPLPPTNATSASSSNSTQYHTRKNSAADTIITNALFSNPPNSNDGPKSDGVDGTNTIPVSKAEHDRIKEAERARRKSIGAHLIYQKTSTWSAAKERILTGPYDYLYGHPGKDIRAQLIAAFNAWLKVPEESLAVITRVVGMLHTASLLVDDVEDSSQLRRGVPVAHSIYGVAQTLNSANYVYFLALAELQHLSNPALAIDIYTNELLNLHRGQGMDLYWRDTLTCPTEDDYLEMVNNKTGGLFRLAVKLMQAESKSCDRDFTPLVNTVGLLFQILDDYRNLQSPAYTANKGLAEDLTEGKFSFPVIHAIRSDTSNLVLLSILKQKTNDDEVKRYAVAYMERVGSFAYTRKVLRELGRRAMGLVEEMEKGEVDRGAGTGMRVILEKMRIERPGSGGAAVGAQGSSS